MRNRRGAALLTVILATLVLACMVKALVLLGQRGAFQGRRDLGKAQLVSLSEAGVADVQSELAQELDWATGLSKRMPSGTYTVTFGPTSSVNNMLNKNGSVDGPRGPSTVPPRTADILVVAEADGVKRTVEVLLQKRFMKETPFAMHASGKIRLVGDVRVDGIKNLGGANPTIIPAGIHSNLADPNATDIITYTNGGDADKRGVVTGKVSCVSPNPNALRLENLQSEGEKRGDSKAPDPPIDIDAEITANRSRPAPVIESGTTTLAPGTKSFHQGNLEINGDLNLDEANLYVSGNLTVNGAITGKGAVYVGGKTAFRGDSKVLANNDQGIALLSKGSVELAGFDGTAYLNGVLGSSPNLTETRRYLAQMADIAADPVASGGGQTTNGPIRALMQSLNGLRSRFTGTTQHVGVLTSLIEELEGRPGTDAQKRFMVKKLKTVNGFFDDFGGGYGRSKQGAWLAGGLAPGALDEEIANTGPGADRVWWEVTRSLHQMDLNRLGSSYFQGIIYTNGSIHATNEVGVVGAVWARDNGSQTAEGGRQPGDIVLENGVKLTMVERYVTGESGGASTVGYPTVMSWTERD